MDSDIMESDRMSNSENPESDRMDSDRMESDRISNSSNPESDRMDSDRKESDRMSNSANMESGSMESVRNQQKKKSGGRHHVRAFLTTQVTHCIFFLLYFPLLLLSSLDLYLSPSQITCRSLAAGSLKLNF
jgi:hypothetical protein